MNLHSLPFFLVSLFLTFLSYASNLQRGQEIYSQICVTCHGPNLDGGRIQDQFSKEKEFVIVYF